MALNAKMAMLICSLCIGGSSWLLQSVTVREIRVMSPVVTASVPVAAALGPRSAPADEWSRPPEPTDMRAALVRKFAEPNPLDAEAERKAAAAPSLAIADPDATGTPQPVRLPPVARHTEDPEVMAEPAPIEDWHVETVAYVEPREVPAADGAAAYAYAGDAPDTDLEDIEPNEPPMTRLRSYVVSRGETLTGIARRECGTSDPRMVELLIEQNPHLRKREGLVWAGETLQVPDADSARRMLAAIDARDVVPIEQAPAYRWYTVQKNDSLIRIAQRELNDGDRWREILKLNDSLKPNRIYPGERIKLPAPMRVAQG